MSYDFSIEALMAESTGRVRREEVRSFEKLNGYDGYSDAIFSDLSRATENLEFLDTFANMNAKNAADKIRMLRKIKANYGVRSYNDNQSAAVSIESFCNRSMYSVEEEAAATGGDVNAADKPGDATKEEPKNDGKKEAWYKRLLGALKTIWDKIWGAIKIVAGKIKDFFTGKLFKDLKAKRGANAKVVEPNEVSADDVKAIDEKTKEATEKAKNENYTTDQYGLKLCKEEINIAKEYFNMGPISAKQLFNKLKYSDLEDLFNKILPELKGFENVHKTITGVLSMLEKKVSDDDKMADIQKVIKTLTDHSKTSQGILKLIMALNSIGANLIKYSSHFKDDYVRDAKGNYTKDGDNNYVKAVQLQTNLTNKKGDKDYGSQRNKTLNSSDRKSITSVFPGSCFDLTTINLTNLKKFINTSNNYKDLAKDNYGVAARRVHATNMGAANVGGDTFSAEPKVLSKQEKKQLRKQYS